MTTAAVPSPRSARSWPRAVVGALGYGAILALAWRAIDRDRFVAGLRTLGAADVALVLAVALLHVAARALRYHRLLLRAKPSSGYRWTDGARIFLVGLSASAVTPARVGDFLKAQLVTPYGVAASTGFGIVAVERVLDLLVIAATILGAGAFVSEGASHGWRGAAVGLLLLLVACVFVLSSTRPRAWAMQQLSALLSRVTSRAKQERIEATLSGVFVVWDQIFASPWTFARLFAATWGAWAIEFGKLWLVLRLLGASVPLELAYFVYPVSIVAGIVSLMPFSEGLVGLTGVALLSSVGGVDSATSTVAMVIDRAASSLPPLLLWAIFAAVARWRVDAPSAA